MSKKKTKAPTPKQKQAALIARIKALQVRTTTTSQPDGYGGELDWTYYWLNETPFAKNYDGRPKSDVNYLSEAVVAECLGVPITTELRKLIFEYNPEIFHHIQGMNMELKKLAMGSEIWEDKIKKKKAAINKAIEELMAMEEQHMKRRRLYYLAGGY